MNVYVILQFACGDFSPVMGKRAYLVRGEAEARREELQTASGLDVEHYEVVELEVK